MDPSGPPPELSREDLWRRHILAVEALRLVQDRGCTEWTAELIETLIGREDGRDPMVRGSLADPCDAALQLTDPSFPDDVIDRLPCIYRRGHLARAGTPSHRTPFGEPFKTGESRPC